ncbi:MAG: hypothetical protein JWM93_99 [Frankiales bacterium]|nr:hypothetical protein [Frankiales bacterium]
MSKQLTGTVHVRTDDGKSGVFGPGDTVPKWAADLITNPKAWGAEAAPTPPPPPPGGGGGYTSPERPPVAGKGSGKDAWAAYAAARNVEVDPSATRDEIVAAIEGAEAAAADAGESDDDDDEDQDDEDQ